MAKERGVVKTLVAAKRYGFIFQPVPPGQAKLPDVFFLFGSYPKGEVPTIGDELEFEAVMEPGKKGPKATDITIVSKVIPAAPASSPAATPIPAPQPTQNIASAAPTTAPEPEPWDVIVEFLYDPNQIVSTQEEFSLSVVVRVVEPINSGAVRGATVDLLSDGYQVDFPAARPQTNHEGEAQFRVVYTGTPATPLSITQVCLAAVVTKGGKKITVTELVPRSKTWKAQAVPVTPAQPKLTVQVSEGVGYKQYLVSYGMPDASIPATFEVWPTRSCQIAVSDDGGSNWQTTIGGKLVFPSNSQSVLLVKIEKLAPGVGGENIFIGVQGINSQSGPHYISGIQ